MYSSIEKFMEQVKLRNPGEEEFHQAVHEVVESLWKFSGDSSSKTLYIGKDASAAEVTERVISFFDDKVKKSDPLNDAAYNRALDAAEKEIKYQIKIFR